MKRLSYMACLLLASAAFTACDEDFKDWADSPVQSPGRSYNCNGRYNSGCQYET